MKAAHAKVDREAFYSVEDAIKILKDCAKERKFDETIEISMNLGIDPRHADQAVRGVTSLPHGTGAKVRVAVGKIDFDRCIATPDMMALIGRVAKVLGPKGLMPNPKLGTVTPDVTKAVKAAKAGSIEYRAEKAGIVQAGVGKVSFDDKKLTENVRAFIDTIARAKPSGAKGTYIHKVSITSSMGPGLKLDMDSAMPKEEKAA